MSVLLLFSYRSGENRSRVNQFRVVNSGNNFTLFFFRTFRLDCNCSIIEYTPITKAHSPDDGAATMRHNDYATSIQPGGDLNPDPQAFARGFGTALRIYAGAAAIGIMLYATFAIGMNASHRVTVANQEATAGGNYRTASAEQAR